MGEKVGHVVGGVDRFGHTVVECEQGEAQLFDTEHHAVGVDQAEVDAVFDPGDACDGAVVKDVAGLGGPGGDGALARGDEEAFVALEVVLGGQQGKGALGGFVAEGALGLDEIDFDRVDGIDGKLGCRGVERVLQCGETELREGRTALKNDRLHS